MQPLSELQTLRLNQFNRSKHFIFLISPFNLNYLRHVIKIHFRFLFALNFIFTPFCHADNSIARWNPKISILGTLAQFTILELEYVGLTNWTLGLGYTHLSSTQNYKSIKLTGFKFYGNYFFNPIHSDSFWIGFYNGTNKVYSTSIENEQLAKLNMQTNSFGLRSGYHWWWQNWNLSLGYNLGISAVKKVKVYDSLGNLTDEKDTAGVELSPELFLGYLF